MEAENDDDQVAIKYISNKNCKTILYEDCHKRARKTTRKVSTSEEYLAPKHHRVATLLKEMASSGRKSARCSSATARSLISDALMEIDDAEDEEEIMAPVLQPKVLFPNNSAGSSRSSPVFPHLSSSKKNKERMQQKVMESREKYLSEEVTPKKSKLENGNSQTPKHKPTTPQTPSSRGRRTPQPKQPTTPQTPALKAQTPSSRGRRTSQPPTPRTPMTASKIVMDSRTPRIQRQNIAKQLKTLINDGGSDASDWSGTESEESSDMSDYSAPPTPRAVTPQHSRPTTPIVNVVSSVGIKTRSKTKSVYKSDDYFTSHGSTKVVTSDKTLGLLQNPRLNADTLQDNLKQIPTKHKKELQQLWQTFPKLFEEWMCLLLEGFNILLHGLGSKTFIVNAFCKHMLSENYDAIVINGFFTTLTIKDILKSIAEDVAYLSSIPNDESELCDAIVSRYCSSQASNLFLLLNNLDGAMLQSSKTQNILARLASSPKIHLLATIDHVNAPLLLDQAQLCRFNFVWQDVTNFHHYTEETAFENSLLVQQHGGLALASLRSVFQSLTSNARDIFKLIMEHQLNSKDPKYSGIPFSELYNTCRDNFLVTTDLSMRTQLTEFLDHQLLRSKRSHDGSELLLIPIPRATLKEFQSTQEE